MPLYQCLVPVGSVDDRLRSELAEAITTAHTSVTGAPRGFVNVVFTEYRRGSFFTAGQPHDPTVISGSIRAGRSRADRAELLSRLSEAWTSITGQEPTRLVIGLDDVDPTSIMEAGLIMPAPGEEAAWLERHGDELGELLATE